jgi:hypothetical protein
MNWKAILVLGVVICMMAVYATVDCSSKSTFHPSVQIEWPSGFSQFSNTLPIASSGLQGVRLRLCRQELPSGAGKLVVAVYYFEDSKQHCRGSVTCLVDTREKNTVTLMVGGSVPVRVKDHQDGDYSVANVPDATDGWVVFRIKPITPKVSWN